MIAFTVHTSIAAPREEIFDLIADLSARSAFTDHYVEDLHLTSPRSSGLKAGARYRIKRGKVWMDTTIAEADRPRRIVEQGRIGRLGRTRISSTYELSPGAGGSTRVELTTWTQPQTRIDGLKEAGLRRWLRRQSNKSLDRLRKQVEEGSDRPIERTRVAGYEPLKAPRFGSR